MTAAATDAGTIVIRQTSGSREGFQVFVKVYRWSEKRLKDHPETGGLLDVPAEQRKREKTHVKKLVKALYSIKPGTKLTWNPVMSRDEIAQLRRSVLGSEAIPWEVEIRADQVEVFQRASMNRFVRLAREALK